MELYFSPLACSMASRIVLHEAGASARFIEVDSKTKRTLDGAGADYRAVHPLGLVPALKLGDGQLLLENAAILQYLAASLGTDLVPSTVDERARLQQWLSFIGTELHKGIFAQIFDRKAPEAVKAYALEKAPSRLAFLAAHLKDREVMLDRFSVADAYAFTVLHWTRAIPQLKISAWPALEAYVTRHKTRPSIAKAVAEEMPLFLAEQARAS